MNEQVENVELITVRTTHHNGVPVLNLAGELDIHTTGVMRSAIATQLADRPEAFVVDLGGVTFLGSSGISALVDGCREARQRGIGFAVASDQRPVRRPLQISGVLNEFTLHPTLADAVHAVRSGHTAE